MLKWRTAAQPHMHVCIYLHTCIHTYIYIYIYIYIIYIYIYRKRKNSLPWCHYKSISGRDDHHQMYWNNFFLFGCFFYLSVYFIWLLVPMIMGFKRKISNQNNLFIKIVFKYIFIIFLIKKNFFKNKKYIYIYIYIYTYRYIHILGWFKSFSIFW